VDDLYHRRGLVKNSGGLGICGRLASVILQTFPDNFDSQGNVRQNSSLHKQATSRIRQQELAEWGMT
jgi:hypothetical protein